mmetsp:Transcript_80594/g.125578  ORF Transcript_80594/g.125578 Transcript_80594/m.125578 type:complete len:101 (-) Transcript_80594:32-334(-)
MSTRKRIKRSLIAGALDIVVLRMMRKKRKREVVRLVELTSRGGANSLACYVVKISPHILTESPADKPVMCMPAPRAPGSSELGFRHEAFRKLFVNVFLSA